MGEDVWCILVTKAGGNNAGQTVITQAMRKGCSAIVRVSRAWFNMVRDTKGRVVDRKVVLSDFVYAPNRVTSWNEVPKAYRSWDADVADYESLMGMHM